MGGSLVAGIPSRFRLDPATTGSLLNGSQSFTINVPSDATALSLRLASDDPSVDVDLYVRYGADPTVSRYDWRSVGPTGNEEILIGAHSSRSLRAGTYYISLLLYDSVDEVVSGTLTASFVTATSADVGGPLIAGIPSRFRLGPASSRSLLNGSRSYTIDVPGDASALSLELISDNPSVDIDLYVRYQSDPTVFSYDWRSIGYLGNEEIVIRADTEPPLRPGIYYVSLLLYDTIDTHIGGTLTARVTRHDGGDDSFEEHIEFVRIPAGQFTMGSNSSESAIQESPLTQVFISSPFEIGKYEVTQEQWLAVMRTNPSTDAECGSTCPIDNVSWDDVQQYLELLNERSDEYEYRLPTEAEWEYAARAATVSDRYGQIDAIAWFDENSESTMKPVGLKVANQFGLFDMLGNAWEWVADWYGWYSGGIEIDPRGPDSGLRRVFRGGGAGNSRGASRASARLAAVPSKTYRTLGFRLVRSATSLSEGGELRLGVPRRFEIPASETGVLQNGDKSFFVDVPASATRLRIAVVSDNPGAVLGVYVRYREDSQETSFNYLTVGVGNLELRVPSFGTIRSGRWYISLKLYNQVHTTGELRVITID